MTSRNSFYNLMIQDFKQRLWSFALSCVFFFFVFPVNISFVSSILEKDSTNREWYVGEMLHYFFEMVGNDNKLLTFFMIALAVVIALNGFGYLHHKQQVDFFHSLPISRSRWFIVKYMTGVLILAVPYLFFSLIASALVTLFTGTYSLLGNTFYGFFHQMLMVLLCYNAAILAVTLTGTMIMSIFGTLFFFGYIPFVAVLNIGYKSTYFNTYVGTEDLIEKILRYTSPFALALTSGSSMVIKQNLLADYSIAMFMAAGFAVLAYLVFKHRHSESAGKAISVEWMKTPLKILIVIPSGLLFALLLSTIMNNIFWTVFGLLCGILISHCVIEIIYHADFKKLFANIVHLALSFIVALAVLLIYNYDLFGYDTYRPKLSDIRSIGVHIPSLEYDISLYDGSPYSYDDDSGSYETTSDMISRKMFITDPEIIEAILNNAIENEKAKGNYTNQKGSILDYEYSYLEPIRLRYRLQDGRVIDRDYELNAEVMQPVYRKLYESKEYKVVFFPILLSDIGDFAMFQFKTIYGTRNKVYRLNDQFKFERLENAGEILKTYQQELYSLKYDPENPVSPVGYIRFLTAKDGAYIGEKYRNPVSGSGGETKPSIDEKEAMQNSTNLPLIYEITEYRTEKYYPVYPSFTETIRLLQKQGMEIR